MDRTLRPLAVLSLVIAALYMFVVKHGPSPRDTPADPTALRFFVLWAPLLGQTSLLLAFAVGVVALVAALWRGQRAWVAGFLLALLVVAYGYDLFNSYAPVTVWEAFFRTLSFLSVDSLKLAFVPALLPLLALAYLWWPRRASSTASSRHIRVDWALRVLPALSLVVILSLIPAVAYATSLENAGPIDPGIWAFLSLWWPLLGQTSLLLAFAVGVAALSVAQWRGQRAWAMVLLLALLVVAYSYIVVIYATIIFQLPLAFLTLNPAVGIEPLGDGFIPALLPLLVLAYTFWPRHTGAFAEIEAAPLHPPTAGQGAIV